MKVFIQIPCYNEEATLEETINDLPRELPGVEQVCILIADDGSTDNTVELAKKLGVDYIVTHRHNVGLARNFQDALDACLYLGADIIVNTDGDNQYRGDHIHRIVEPIVNGEQDYVVGCRDIKGHVEFSPMKKQLQLLGSFVLRQISNTSIPDATSGFRAMHKDTAIKLNVLNKFSYTLETLIQTGNSDTKIGHVPIGVNSKTRKSRLFKSIPQFVSRQVTTMLRMFAFYAPVKFFGGLSLMFFLMALLSGLWGSFGECPIANTSIGCGTLSSMITIVFFAMGFFSIISGILAANLANVRQMLNAQSTRLKYDRLANKIHPPINIIDCKQQAEIQ